MRITTFSIACLLIVCLVAQLAPSLQAAEEAKPGSVTVQMGGELTASELASLLGAHVWKLDVSLPEGAKQVSVSLYQQSKGKERTGFGAGINAPLTADTKRQLLVAIIPIGATLSDAEKVRVTILGFGMVSGMTVDNLLRKLGI